MELSAQDVEAMECAWIRWPKDDLTSTFWHALENANQTICGFSLPTDENTIIEVSDEQPANDVCGFCTRVLEDKHPVFDSAAENSNGHVEGKRARYGVDANVHRETEVGSHIGGMVPYGT